MEGLVSPFEILAQGVAGLFGHFSSVLDYINPFSENFLLNGVLNSLGTMINYLNPFNENFILNGVLTNLGNMLNYINPFSDNFLGKKIIEMFSDLFEYLFIPTGNQFEDLQSKFDEKFAFIGQIKELVGNLFFTTSTYSTNGDYPSLNITYMGTTVSIVDFSVFDQYRDLVHAIIIAVLYIAFILRLVKRLPGIIGGFHD